MDPKLKGKKIKRLVKLRTVGVTRKLSEIIYLY